MRFSTYGMEAVPRYPQSDDYDWVVRHKHPDGAGYAAITRPIRRELAELWAKAANEDEQP